MNIFASLEKVGVPAVGHFAVTDADRQLVSGLVAADFTVRLWNPHGVDVSSSVPVAVAEEGSSGSYQATFTPNAAGTWLLEVIHATHFPGGIFAEFHAYSALYYVPGNPRITEDLCVRDAGNNRVTGLAQADFTFELWNPSGADVSAAAAQDLTLTELGNGEYRVRYDADDDGVWLLVVKHATYFSYGQRADRRYVSADAGDDEVGIVEALHQLISLDAQVAARLATWQFTDGVDSPAVFTTDVIPENADLPAVIINRSGGLDFGTRGREGEDAYVTVRVYDDKHRDSHAFRRTAELIRALVNRAELTLTDGRRAFRCLADPPAVAPDPDGFPGYLIAVRVLVLE